MVNKLLVALFPEGYFLSKSVKDEEGIIQWEPVLKSGKSIGDVYTSLTSIPDEFYQEGVEVTYGCKKCSIPILEREKQTVEKIVKAFELLKRPMPKD